MRTTMQLLALAAPICARDIVFSPVAAVQFPLGDLGPNDFKPGEDISSSPYLGLTTFANLPYTHCLANSSDVEPFDIAILGAPFDTVRSLLM